MYLCFNQYILIIHLYVLTVTVRGCTLVVLCRRQILTYKDSTHTVRVKILIMVVDIGIQMNQKELTLTTTFMMLSN